MIYDKIVYIDLEMYYERKIRLYDIDEWRKLYNLNFMNFEKIFSPYNPCIYTDCRGKYFFFPYINYWGALKAFPYRNRDALPKSAPFYKKGALACKRHLFKIGALS
jgi:hypothetical protein